MPDITKGRIESGSGNVTYGTQRSIPLPASVTLVPASRPVVRSVTGSNIGFGTGFFAGTNGVEHIVLEFKSIVAGNGLVIEERGDEIVIGFGAPVVRRFVDLLDTPDEIVAGGLLWSSLGNRLEWVPPPSDQTPQVLRWMSGTLSWVQQSLGTVEEVSVLGQNGVTVTGSPITTAGTIAIGLVPVTLPGTFTAATIVLDAFGRVTSAQSNALGEVNTGRNVGGGARLFVSKTGSILNFRQITAEGAISVTEEPNVLRFGLTPSGVVEGVYTLPTITIDSFGRVTQASGRRILGSGGITITEDEDAIIIGGAPATIAVSEDDVLRGNSFTRLNFIGPVAVAAGAQPDIIDITVNEPPIRAITNLGVGVGMWASTTNGTAALRTLIGANGTTITQGPDSITIDGGTQSLDIYQGGILRADNVLDLDFRDGIQTTLDGPTRIRLAFVPPVIGATNLGSSGLFSTLNPSTRLLEFRGIRGTNGVSVTEVGSDIVISQSGLTVTSGSTTFPLVQTINLGMNLSATGSNGTVTVGFNTPAAPITAIANLPGTGARLFSTITGGVAQFRRLVGGTGISITETTNAVSVNGFSVAGSGGVTVTLDAPNNRWVVSTPVVPDFSALDNGGLTGGVVGSTGSFGWSFVRPSPGTGYFRRIVGINGIVVSQGGAVTSGVSNDLIIDGSAFSSLVQPTGVTAGTYSFPVIGVNALGRITTASSRSVSVVAQNIAGTGGVTVLPANQTIVPGGTFTVRRLVGSPSIAVTASSNDILVNLVPTGVTPGTYANPAIAVDVSGRITAITSGAGPGSYQVFEMLFQLDASGAFTNVIVPVGWTSTIGITGEITFTHNLGRFPASVFFIGNDSAFRTVIAEAPPIGSLASDLAVSVTTNSFTCHGVTVARIYSAANAVNRVMVVL